MKPFYFEAKSEQEVDIHIFGAIGWDESSWNDGTNNTAYALVSLLKRLDKSYARINVHINSPGGIIDDGLAIYNTLKQAKAEIHTYNAGLTASMASILMLAGTSHMPKTSIFHLHSASTITMGNIREHERTIEQLRVFESTLQQAISDKTGLVLSEIQEKWFDGEEHYMTAEQANEFGFVDVLEEQKVKLPANIENLQSMRFNQVVELYKDLKDSDTEPSFWEKVKQVLNISNNNPKYSDMDKSFAFKAKLTVLLALIGLEQLVFNSENKTEFSLDDVFKINDALENKDNEINSLKNENIVLREQEERLQAKISEMQALIDKTPQDAVNPKTTDNSTANTGNNEVVELDPETSAALQAYNKKVGIIK